MLTALQEAFVIYHYMRSAKSSGHSIRAGGDKYHVIFSDGKCLGAVREGGVQCVCALTRHVLLVSVSHFAPPRHSADDRPDVDANEDGVRPGMGRVGSLGVNVSILEHLRQYLDENGL
mmetsp:Transcript_13148/g.25803  ORF Transcript_13148/g.25803 Transcript_13148/m.25803 type:complete len:118 (+) Transcript_13148:3-356(+)